MLRQILLFLLLGYIGFSANGESHIQEDKDEQNAVDDMIAVAAYAGSLIP